MSTLVRFPNWLGDVVMALPAWRALRVWAKGERLSVALPAALAPVASMIEGVDEVVPLASSGKAWGSAFVADVERVCAARFDRVVLLTNSFGSAWMMARAGVPERWGYHADARSLLLTRGVSRRQARRRAWGHHAGYYLALLEALGIDVHGIRPERDARLVPGKAVVARADELLAQRGISPEQVMVGFAPGAAFGAAKRWPPEYVAQVIQRLSARGGVACVMVGAPADRETGAAIESAVGPGMGGPHGGGPLVNLIGATDVTTLAAVLARCRVVVSNDSGAMHVAASVGTHVVVPFGPTDERATAPLGSHQVLTADVFCRPCHLRTCPIDHRCMRRIGVDAVSTAVYAVLDARKEAP